MKRHSSSAAKLNALSPGSAGEDKPLRHAVGGRQRLARIGLPRNHSSGRNLAKQGKQTQHAHPGATHADDERRHARHRSHEGDTEIRLPGSLDESRPPMRRNMTAYDLPRNVSKAKLKKNLSHGQLTRLGQSSKNLAGLGSTSHKAPPSPGLRGKNKRPKSAEIVPPERDLHEQEVELFRQQQERKTQHQQPKKVGFAVGSAGDTSDGDEVPDMEGSGLQEDEWTDQSNSASPYSTRQNTANNSRRTSVIMEKPPDKPVLQPLLPSVSTHSTEARHFSPMKQTPQRAAPQADITPMQSDTEDEETSPHTVRAEKPREENRISMSHQPKLRQPPQPNPSQIRSPLHAAKDHPNPTMKRLTSTQMPAPALVSSVSALDSTHNSSRDSPAASLRSSHSNLGNTEGAQSQEEGELVSRFIPSASHPSTGSAGNTGAYNTPNQRSFNMPDEENPLHRTRTAPTQAAPVSPGSTVSGSSGAATPGLGRSRIELRMMHDKALADREAAAERQPLVPHHIYDRRNETLKFYLNSRDEERDGTASTAALSLGPEIFQGRFKAVNTELKVVQKFRDPIAEAVERLRKSRGNRLTQRPAQKQADALKPSKSAVSLPARAGASRESSKLSTSMSPAKHSAPTQMAKSDSPSKSALPASKSSMQIQESASERRHPRRGVSFAGTPPQSREIEREDPNDPDAIARGLWNSVVA
jgi:hypothetical protein